MFKKDQDIRFFFINCMGRGELIERKWFLEILVGGVNKKFGMGKNFLVTIIFAEP